MYSARQFGSWLVQLRQGCWARLRALDLPQNFWTHLRAVKLPQSAEAIADRLALLGCVWFAGAAAWGLFGPMLAGHYGFMASFGIAGENMLTWGIVGPTFDYVRSRPLPEHFYAHHPWGNFWLTALSIAIFGRHDFALSLPAVVLSSATPPLLFGLCRRAFGSVPAAAAVLVFVTLPVCVGFAHFHNVEVSVIFGVTLCFYGHYRMLTEDKWRFLWLSAAGAVFAASADWPSYPMLAALLGWGLLRGFVIPRRFLPPADFRKYASWWAALVTLVLGTFMLWVACFQYSGKLADWIGSAALRTGGAFMPAEGRDHWNNLMLTPPAIVWGAAMVPVALVRLLVRRTDSEVYGLAGLVGATAHFVLFPQAADIHIFWVQYFAIYLAFAAAQLVATLIWASSASLRRVGQSRWLGAPAFGALALVLVYSASILPDTIRSLVYARATGGRYNERGSAIHDEHDAVLVLNRLSTTLPPSQGVSFHSEFHPTSLHGWALHRPSSVATELPRAPSPNLTEPYFVTRASSLSTGDQQELARRFFVEVFGDVWLVHTTRAHAPLQAFALREREPTALEWYLWSGVVPRRAIEPDPQLTWEWRVHMNQPGAPVLVQRTNTLDELRVLHNAAADRQDAAARARYRDGVLRHLDRSVQVELPGVRLLGRRLLEGVEPRLELWFEPTHELSSSARFTVESKVIARRALQIVPLDPILRDASAPWSFPSAALRTGFLYAYRFPLRQRLGVEQYVALWHSGNGVPSRVPVWTAE